MEGHVSLAALALWCVIAWIVLAAITALVLA